jgi:hypothetical protein
MRILKQGTNYRVTCEPGCGTLLEFDLADVTLVYRQINVGPHDIECMPEREDHYHGTVVCLSCKRTLGVKLSREDKRQLLAKQDAASRDY